MPFDEGMANWARSMRRAARRAEEHARKWKVNTVAGITNQPPSPSDLTPEQLQQVAAEHAEKVACWCKALPQVTGDKKPDHELACTDVWLEYLNGKLDLDALKKRIDEVYGAGAFDRANKLANEICPL